MLISEQMRNCFLVIEVKCVELYRKRMIVQPTVTMDFQQGSCMQIQQLA